MYKKKKKKNNLENTFWKPSFVEFFLKGIYSSPFLNPYHTNKQPKNLPDKGNGTISISNEGNIDFTRGQI